MGGDLQGAGLAVPGRVYDPRTLSPEPTESQAAEAASERWYDLDRTTAFSDGVMAIAITLVVLTVEVPKVPDSKVDDLPRQLLDIAPQALTYFLTFFILGRWWLAHHRLFGDLDRIDARMTSLNLGFLSIVAFFPFSAEVMGEYGGQAIAVMIYAISLTVTNMFLLLMIRHSLSRGLFKDERARAAAMKGQRRAVILGLGFLASVPVALLSAPAAIAIWIGALGTGLRQRAA